MDFALTEDQQLIRDAAERFLAESSDSAAVRAAMQSDAGHDPQIWQRIAGELGWCALAVAEDCGGLGLGPVEQVLLFEQCGRHLLCAPLFSTIGLAATLLAETARDDVRQQRLGAIAGGELRATATLDAGDTLPVAHAIGDDWLLEGQASAVLDGAQSQYIYVIAQIAGQDACGVFEVPHGVTGLRCEQRPVWDLTRRYDALHFDALKLPAQARVDEPARTATGLRRARALAGLWLAAEQLGGAQACLDMTLAYTRDRRQFGRAIASFQAVKHRCAEMMVKIESTRSMVYGAAAHAQEAADLELLLADCAAAKCIASDTYYWCAQEAIQLHGGVGFTWEYDPQLHFKRAQAGSRWLGTPEALRAQLAQALFDGRVAA